jgi:hypothetical protein
MHVEALNQSPHQEGECGGAVPPPCCSWQKDNIDVRYPSRRELFRLYIVSYDAADTLQAPGLGQGEQAPGRPCVRTAIRPPVSATELITIATGAPCRLVALSWSGAR